MLTSKLKNFLVFHAAALGGLAFINHSISRLSENGFLTEEKGSYIPSQYGRVYYETSGTGSVPLLLIHDALPSSSSQEWTALSKELQKECTIFCLDLPGCGRSDKPSFEYTNYFYARFIHHFMETVIQKPCCICAIGISASFAITVSHLYPESVRELILINPVSLRSLSSGTTEYAGMLRILVSLPVLGTAVYNITQSRSSIEYELREKYYYNPFLVQKAQIEERVEAAHKGRNNGRFLLASRKGGYLNWDVRNFLSESKIPILILYGEKHPKARTTAAAYRKINPSVTCVPVRSSKGMPHLENPKETAACILRHASQILP